MGKAYVIYNPNRGYFYEDEDCIGGWDYSFTLDKWTVLFADEESAEFHKSKEELIREVLLHDDGYLELITK